MFAAPQYVHALNRDFRCTQSCDARSHRPKTPSEIDDLRFARGIDDHAFPFCQHSRHQCMFGRTDRNSREFDTRAAQALGGICNHIAFAQLDSRPKRKQSTDVQIDRARTDRATTGK